MARTKLGSMIVDLVARTSKFKKGMKRASSRVTAFTKTVGVGMAKVAKFGGIMAGAAAAGAGAATVAYARFGKRLEHVSNRLGMTAGNLSELRNAALLTGSNIEQLDEGLSEMVQRLGEATAGEGEAAEALERMGLNAQQLLAMKPDQAFQRISDSIRGLEGRGQQLFALDQIFGGTEGRELSNLVLQGSQGIEKLRDRAREMGLVMGDEAAANAAKLSRSMGMLYRITKRVMLRIGQALAPTVQKATDSMLEHWQKHSSSVIKTIKSLAGYVQSAFSGIGKGVGWLQEKVAQGFFAMQWVSENWRDVMLLVFKGAQLKIVEFANSVSHFFTETIPSTLTWFANNWRDIFADVFNWTKTVFVNLASNIGRILSNIPDLIRGSVSFGELWTPLTAGFESALSEMPDIAERQVTGLEKQLGEELAALRKATGKSYSDFMQTRMETLAGMGGAGTGILSGGGLAQQIQEGIEGGAAGAAQKAGQKMAEKIGSPRAIEAHTAEAYSAALPRMQAKPMKQTAQHTRSMDQRLGRMEQMMRRNQGKQGKLLGA